MIGEKFHRLTVIERVGVDKSHNSLYLCVCDCGGKCITRSFMLKSGRTTSCGCYFLEVRNKPKTRITVTEKVCSKCGETKSSTLFGRKSTAVDGLTSQCKYCKNVQYKRENSGKVLAGSTGRKKHIRLATPEWSDTKLIKEIYTEAATKSGIMGMKFHVDHIIPLRGENVCGLHVPNNLQIITSTDNLKKGSNYKSQ